MRRKREGGARGKENAEIGPLGGSRSFVALQREGWKLLELFSQMRFDAV